MYFLFQWEESFLLDEMIQRERDNLKEIIPNLPKSIAHAMVAFIICGIMAFLVVIIELQAKLLNYFLGSNKSNINHVSNFHLLSLFRVCACECACASAHTHAYEVYLLSYSSYSTPFLTFLYIFLSVSLYVGSICLCIVLCLSLPALALNSAWGAYM